MLERLKFGRVDIPTIQVRDNVYIGSQRYRYRLNG